MERLREMRNKAGLTQQEVADAVGTARETLARYEGGSREPSLDMLKKLADLFHVSADYLMERTDNPVDYTHRGITVTEGMESILRSNKEDLPPSDQEKVQFLGQRALVVGQGKVVTLPDSSLDVEWLAQFVRQIVDQALDERDKQRNDQ